LQYAFQNRDILPQAWQRRGKDGKMLLMELLHRTMFPEMFIRARADGLLDGTYSTSTKQTVPSLMPLGPSLVSCPALIGTPSPDGGCRNLAFGLGVNSYAPPGVWDPKDLTGHTSPYALGSGADFHRLRQLRHASKIYVLLEEDLYVVQPYQSSTGMGIRYLHNNMTNILYGDGHAGTHPPYIMNRGNYKGNDSAGRPLYSNDGRWCYYGQNIAD